MVNHKNPKNIKNNKNDQKIPQKVAKKTNPIIHKTINIFNYTNLPQDKQENLNAKRKISGKSKSTKKSRTIDTQMPKRGLTDIGFTKTFRNRAIQATEEINQIEGNKNQTSSAEISQQNILNFIHDSNNILGLLTDFVDFSSSNEDERDVGAALLCKNELKELCKGYFISKEDFIEKLNNSDVLSFESAIWVLFTHYYLDGTTGRPNDSKISESRLTKFFIDSYFCDENEPMIED